MRIKIKEFNNLFLISLITPIYINFFLMDKSDKILILSYLFYIFISVYTIIFDKDLIKKNTFKTGISLYFLIFIFFLVSSLVNIFTNNNIIIFVPFVYLLLFFPLICFFKLNNIIEIQSFIKKFNICFFPLIFYLIVLSFNDLNYKFGRFTPNDLQPNYVGEIILIFFLTSFFYKKNIFKLLTIFLSLYLMYLIQSRGNQISAYLFLILYYNNILKRNIFIIIGIFLIIFLMKNFIFNQILLIDNEFRGLNSNFTGRVENWFEGLEYFYDNIFFGTGYGTNTYVHNAFIRMFSELGIVLSSIISLILLRILFTGYKLLFRENVLNRYFISTFIIMMFNLFFSTRYINLNIMSVYMLIAVVYLTFNTKDENFF